MDFIGKRDINLNDLEKIKCESSSEAFLYRDGNLLYKMYKNAQSKKVQRKIFKLLILNDGDKIENTIIPDGLVLDSSFLLGSRMIFINSASSVYRFTDYEKSVRKYLNLINNISQTLKTIHSDPRNIIVGDLNFNNILFDKNMNHYFIDFDSCMVDGIAADRIPMILKNYAKKRGDYKFEINTDTDKLSLMLNTLYVIFGRHIDLVSMREYDEKAERLTTLRNAREFVELIKKDNQSIPEVPYIDELIHKEDIKVLARRR